MEGRWGWAGGGGDRARPRGDPGGLEPPVTLSRSLQSPPWSLRPARRRSITSLPGTCRYWGGGEIGVGAGRGGGMEGRSRSKALGVSEGTWISL